MKMHANLTLLLRWKAPCILSVIEERIIQTSNTKSQVVLSEQLVECEVKHATT